MTVLLSQSEVDQLYLAVQSIHNILGLNVSMGYVDRVAVINRPEKVEHYVLHLSFGKVCLVNDSVKELSTRTVFHHQVKVLRILICFKILHNVRVVKSREDLNFLADEV